jgi:hypothetical protein
MVTDANGKLVVEKIKRAQEEGRLADLIVKGVQWTNFHDWFRGQIKEMFLEVLVEDGNFVPVKMAYKEKFLRQFKVALDALDHAEMEKFATRVKRSGRSGKAQALQ